VGWTSGRITAAGRALSYRRRGPPEAPPLLYLHDAGAETPASPAFEELAGDHDVVLLDLPGYAGSDGPTGLACAAGVGELVALSVEELGWSSATLVGTSLGGWFAVEAALSRPASVTGLVLADAAGLHTPEHYLFGLFASGQASVGTQQRVTDSILDRLPHQEWDRARPDGGVAPEVAAALLAPYAQSVTAAVAASWHPFVTNPRLSGRLCEVRAPTVVVWGADDPLIPLAHGRTFAAEIPGARLRVAPRGGHLVALTEPALFAAAVREITVQRRNSA
jgi:pimeloyl-ACP methyl ester carboxylesterase